VDGAYAHNKTMKQIPVSQLVVVSSLIAVFFWIYAILKNNFETTQRITDLQVSWISLVVSLVFLVVWFAIFNLLYRFTNVKYWIGKIFVYTIGMFFSLVAFDLFFVPIYYYLDWLALFKKSGLLNTFSNAVHNYLFFCMGLIFITHESHLIFINKNQKIVLRISWLILMILVVSYFAIRRYLF
jgi:hypothetical protein